MREVGASDTSLVMEVVGGPPRCLKGRGLTDGPEVGCEKNTSRLIAELGGSFGKDSLAMWITIANFLVRFCSFVS